jgi:filamentous hemagglutinin
MDAAGQYAQSGAIRPGQTAFAATIGLISGPLGASFRFTGNVLLGGAGGAVNTAFNNTVYGENNSPIFAGALGGLFGGTGYVISSLATLGMKQITYPFVYNNLNPKVPALFQGTPNPTPVISGATVGSVVQGGASFIPGQPAPTRR